MENQIRILRLHQINRTCLNSKIRYGWALKNLNKFIIKNKIFTQIFRIKFSPRQFTIRIQYISKNV